MKFLTSQVAAFLRPAKHRRNVQLLLKFLGLLVLLVTAYSVIFHALMVLEGQEHSWLTGFYWTLTVMSTLGFGDITFTTDVGRFFSIVVLLSGMIFLLVLLPFTFIEFFYAPWMQAQAEMRAPRELPPGTRGHVILTHYDPVSSALIAKLDHYGYPYALLVPDLPEALRFYDLGVRVVYGEIDRPETYRLVRADQALLVAATGSDMTNTNVAFTVRELSQRVPIVATADSRDSVDILKLAGSSQVIELPELMGQALARRISGADARAHVIGNFGDLLIAEATAAGTPLVGKTIAQSGIRSHTGMTVAGLWQRGEFAMATAESRIEAQTVLVLAGSGEQLRRYDEWFCIYHVSGQPVMIIGGGRVGMATARALAEREVDYRIVEKDSGRMDASGKFVHGNAADLGTLKRAGIETTPAVVITPNEDDTSIYVTIYCRRLRPDVQIISRATKERNVSTLHRAGADFVLSYASMGATAIFNFLKQTNILLLAEGLHVTETDLPYRLEGKTLAEAAIPHQTGCTVVALRYRGKTEINPGPDRRLEVGAELVLICTPEAEKRFLQFYQAKKLGQQAIGLPGGAASL
jgi:Trk K+ transport system NAD-binding subunit